MHRNSLLFVVLLALVAGGKCDDILPSLTGGINTLPGEAPSVVSIRVPLETSTASFSFCSGTIVNANHVLTSARCVINSTGNLINPFWFRIIAGDLNIFIPSYRRFTTTASHIYVHPDFTRTPFTNDVAVIRTTNSFPLPHNTIDWAVRNTRLLPNQHDCRFIGWGSNIEDGPITATQQRVAVPIIDRADCNAANVHQGQVLEHMICAGSITATIPISGVCTGNMGGGLFCNVNNWWEFTGILSFGIGCGGANQPGVYTQVRFFEAWINQQFTRTDATPPGMQVVS